jgi:hypothetical protein
MSTIDTTGYQIKVSNLPLDAAACDVKEFFAQHGFGNIRIKPIESYPRDKQPGVEHVWVEDELVNSAIDKLQGKIWRNHEIALGHDLRYHFDAPGQPKDAQETEQRNR